MADMDVQKEIRQAQAERERKYPFGFRQNLRVKGIDYEIRLEFLDSMLKGRYKITTRRLLIGSAILLSAIFSAILFLSSNGLRAKYMGIPTVLMVISIVVLSICHMLVDISSEESLLHSAVVLVNQQITKHLVDRGRMKVFRKMGIADMDERGIIYFANGDVGELFLVDGSTSLTAYPDEVERQKNIAQQYQKGRGSNGQKSYEIKITSSQQQNTDEQQRKAKDLEYSNRHNEAIRQVCQDQYNLLANYIDGRHRTVIQYLMIVSQDREAHEEYIQRLETFTDRGLYFKLTHLNDTEAERVLTNLLYFRSDETV